MLSLKRSSQWGTLLLAGLLICTFIPWLLERSVSTHALVDKTDERSDRAGRIELMLGDCGQSQATLPRSGSFQIESCSGTAHSIAVSRGQFLIPAAMLPIKGLSSLSIDGNQATFLTRNFSDSSSFLVLEATWSPGPSLRVVDSRTQENLEEVTVIASRSPLEAGSNYPPESRRDSPLIPSAPSPLDLPLGVQSRTLWIGAPGFAWKRVSQFENCMPELVQLELGVDLTVLVPAAEHGRGAHFVRLLQDSKTVAAYHLVDAQDIEFAGLNRGNYSVQLELGHDDGPRTILARKQVQLFGEQQTIQFDSADSLPGPGQLKITLPALPFRIPEQLQLRMVHAEGEVTPFTIHQKNFQPSGFGHFTVTLPQLQEGVWRLSLLPWGTTTEVEIHPASLAHAELELPQLVPVRLWPIDGQTEEPMESMHLSWRSANKSLSGQWSVQTRKDPSLPFEFWVPVGELEAFVIEEGYLAVPQRLDVRYENEELVFVAQPTTPHRVELSLTCEGQTVQLALQDWEAFDLVAAAHSGKIFQRSFGRQKIGSSFASPGIDLIVDHPGLYRLQVGELRGYSVLHESLQVDVSEEGPTRLEIRLKKI